MRFRNAVTRRPTFDVCALVAGDTDYVPLVRKLNTLGTRVMALGWNVEHTDQNGKMHQTRTSQVLLNEVTYPILMSDLIDNPRNDKEQAKVDKLFLDSSNQ